VGAGFASGQEIMQFFTSFGMLGLVGAIVSSALFIFLAMALVTLGQNGRPSRTRTSSWPFAARTWARCSTG